VDKSKDYSDLYYFLKIKDGDEKAFDYLFQRYYAGMCIYCNKIINDIHLSEEIVQNVFYKFWRDRKAIDVSISVKSYLFTAVKNRCIDILRHRKVNTEFIQKFIETTSESEDLTWNTYIETELFEILMKAIEKLPPECKKIFYDSRIKNIPNSEIARIYNLSIKTIENQITKALKILREEFKDYI
jgi:RNA polymerase sigma-70 factor (ECF subfamily)